MNVNRRPRSIVVRAAATLVLLGVLGLLVVLDPATGTRPVPRVAQALAARSPVTSKPVGGAAGARALARHRVVGLGDSVVSGSHCACVPFVQRYAGLTAHQTDAQVGAHNLGVPGLTTAGLRRQLDRPEVTAVVRRADIVTVTIGANDMAAARRAWVSGTCARCFVAVASVIRRNTDAVLARIAELRGGRRTEVLVTTYWNVFEEASAGDAHPAGYRAMAERATRRTNEAVCGAAEAAGRACVDLYGPFKGNGRDPSPLLASDRDHPSSAGHRLIAQSLARHGWRELGVSRGSGVGTRARAVAPGTPGAPGTPPPATLPG